MASRKIVVFVVSVLLLGIGACSSTPKPKNELLLTQAALEAAEASGAKQYAPIELRTAHEQKAQADAYMKKEQYAKARKAADQSLATAELAKAKAELEKSRAAVNESREGLELMETELERVKNAQ